MKKSIISRTISVSVVDGIKVNLDTRTVEDFRRVIESKYDTPEKALKELRKTDSSVVSVTSVIRKESLVGMYESDFVSMAKAVDARTKETRGMISKEISIKSAHVLEVTSDRQVKDAYYVGCFTEKEARKACTEHGTLFVQLVSVDESKQLYVMPYDDFVINAKPMKDRFTLA